MIEFQMLHLGEKLTIIVSDFEEGHDDLDCAPQDDYIEFEAFDEEGAVVFDDTTANLYQMLCVKNRANEFRGGDYE